MHVLSEPIMEDCTGVRIAPIFDNNNNTDSNSDSEKNVFISVSVPLRTNEISNKQNKWNFIHDFNHLLDDIPSPNFSIIEHSKRICFEKIECVDNNNNNNNNNNSNNNNNKTITELINIWENEKKKIVH